jgi:protocatechuate 3,4-dioxygenase, alpha subunit
MTLAPTPSQTVGPFFSFGLTTEKSSVRCIAGPLVIEIWQADANGKYNHPDDGHEKVVDSAFTGFGRMGTGEDGACEFETIKPGRVPGPGNVLQAPHLSLAVFGRGMLKQLYTRVYFSGDSANQEDPIRALVPEDRRDTLMAHSDPAQSGIWRFDVHLQGEHETVFFDF